MNKLTIIRGDSAVYIDGRALSGLDMSIVPTNVHALQWNAITNTGTIEIIGQADEVITALPSWANTCVVNWNTLQEQLANPVLSTPTEAEKIATIKQHAISLLKESDWSMLTDVSIVNKADWIMYRTLLRTIAQNPQLDSVIPTKPEEVWS